jgi:hypothetical protein
VVEVVGEVEAEGEGEVEVLEVLEVLVETMEVTLEYLVMKNVKIKMDRFFRNVKMIVLKREKKNRKLFL